MAVSGSLSFGSESVGTPERPWRIDQKAMSGSKMDLSALSAGHPDDLTGRIMRCGKDKKREILQSPSSSPFSCTTSLYPFSVSLAFKALHPLHTVTPSYFTLISLCLSTKSTVPPPLPSLVQATAESMARILSETRTNQGLAGTRPPPFAHKAQYRRPSV